MRFWKRVLLGIVAVLLLAVGGFVVWGLTPPAPMAEAQAALESGDGVDVQTDGWLVFTPQNAAPSTGLIFYPGGRVDPRSYAPEARAIAAEGFLVVITPVPLNLAVLNPNQADAVVAAFPAITRWAVGGHSLGGAMAASYVYEHPQAMQGLVLWAAYPQASQSLADRPLAVAAVFGERDGLVSPEDVSVAREHLPANTQWTTVAGGNHAQFGWYGEQSGDNPAAISRDEQTRQTVDATVALLRSIQGQ